MAKSETELGSVGLKILDRTAELHVVVRTVLLPASSDHPVDYSQYSIRRLEAICMLRFRLPLGEEILAAVCIHGVGPSAWSAL